MIDHAREPSAEVPADSGESVGSAEGAGPGEGDTAEFVDYEAEQEADLATLTRIEAELAEIEQALRAIDAGMYGPSGTS